MAEKAFKAVNHGTDFMDLRYLGKCHQMIPREIHLKENGSIKDELVFAFVLKMDFMTPVVGQISLEMLNEGLKELGYEIKKL